MRDALVERKSMNNANTPIPAPRSLPENYQEVLDWKVTGRPDRIVIMNVLGVFLFILFGVIFFSLAVRVGRLPMSGGIEISPGLLGSVLLGILLTLILHELAHGWTMRAFGASPKYGIILKGLMFYATSPDHAFPRNHYAVIALAPLISVSVLVVLGMWLLQGTLWVALLALCGVINASGAVGDLWMTMIVLRYENSAYVIDERDGMRVFLPRT